MVPSTNSDLRNWREDHECSVPRMARLMATNEDIILAIEDNTIPVPRSIQEQFFALCLFMETPRIVERLVRG